MEWNGMRKLTLWFGLLIMIMMMAEKIHLNSQSSELSVPTIFTTFNFPQEPFSLPYTRLKERERVGCFWPNKQVTTAEEEIVCRD